MTTPSLPQLNSDVHDLYRLLVEVEQSIRRIEVDVRRQGSRLDQIETNLRGLTDLATTGFATVAERLTAIEAKLDDR